MNNLGEIPNDVEAPLVPLSQDVEQKRVCVVVEGLVIEEELRKETQVLSVCLETMQC